MSLDIGAAITEGVERLRSRDGLVLVGAFLVVGVLTIIARQLLAVEFFETLLQFAQLPDAPPETDVETLREQLRLAQENSLLTVNISAAVAFGFAFVLGIVVETLRIVSVRVFYTSPGDRPTDLNQSLIFATVNGFLGGIVVIVLFSVGFVLFLLPGVFFAVVLFFVRQEIAIEDQNFVDAMAESWTLTRGNRVNIFVLGFILMILFIINRVLIALAAGSFGQNLGVIAICVVLWSVITVFGIATTTRAYAQLKAEDGSDDPTDMDESEPVGALGPDDLPEP